MRNTNAIAGALNKNGYLAGTNIPQITDSYKTEEKILLRGQIQMTTLREAQAAV